MQLRFDATELIEGSGLRRVIDLDSDLCGVCNFNNNTFVASIKYSSVEIDPKTNKVMLKRPVEHLNLHELTNGKKCTEIYELIKENGEYKVSGAVGMYVGDCYVNLCESPLVDGTKWIRIYNTRTKKFGVYDPASDKVIVPTFSSNIYRADTGRSFMLNDTEKKWYLLDEENGQIALNYYSNYVDESNKQI